MKNTATTRRKSSRKTSGGIKSRGTSDEGKRQHNEKVIAAIEDRARGTDDVRIGSQLASTRNPAFAWALGQVTAGNPLNDKLKGLSRNEKRLLRKLEKAGHESPEELIAEFLEKFSAEENETLREMCVGFGPDSPNPAETATMVDAMELVHGTHWLWKSWIPYAALTELFGQPDDGKSALALCGLVRPVVRGGAWPDLMTGPESIGKVLWCDTESKSGETIQRIKDWALPPEEILLPFHDPLQAMSLSKEEDLRRIELLINVHKVKLVPIDALRTAHGQEENSSKVATVLQPLAGIAERTKAAIVVVHHSRKLHEGQEITANDSRGSNAIHAMMRSAIGIDCPDPRSDWRRASVVKSNLGAKPTPIGFRVTGDGVHFGKPPSKPMKKSETGQAEAFLRERLRDGKSHASQPLIEEAGQRGISQRTLQRAASERLGIKPTKKEGHWYWKMPT